MTASTTEKPKDAFFSINNFVQLGLLAVGVIVFRTSVASLYQVPTASMEPTVKVGDRVLAFKLSYDFKLPLLDHPIATWGNPQRGDIVVFKYPRDTSIDFVKRVVGLPGDHIRVVNKILYINDVAQPRSTEGVPADLLNDATDHPDNKDLTIEKLGDVTHWVIQNKNAMDTAPLSEKFPPDQADFIVPENTYFMMGDNRDNSADSRYWGTVPRDYIEGKALFVVWSFWKFDDNYLPHFRFDRFGHSLKSPF